MNRLELILMIIALSGFTATQILMPGHDWISKIDKNIVIPRLFP